ncbi:cytochrome c oxidase subunit II [Anaerobacillus sp. MEB173]|uniref:cytochrome c oxidase subunit II n=1 Tax=Anaerobacillus sp. MEB173 TaxID=3383345 RepID=UPI003F8E4650
MKKWKHLWRLLPMAFILFVLSGCGVANLSALDPKGPVAEMQLSLMTTSIYVMIFVILVVFAIFAYVLIKFRARPGDEDKIPKQVAGNHKLEIIWTTIPILLLIIIAVPTVMLTFALADTEPNEGEEGLKVKVTGHQFWWEFEYPEYGVTVGQDLYIPTGTKIAFDLESKDVIHSFWVPALGGKQDTVPGITNTMWLVADEPGVYAGKCAELCGAAHALMDFKVIAVEPDQFEQWITSVSEATGEPETAVAQQGREVFESSCLGCHAVGGVGGNPAAYGPDLINFGDRETIAGYLEFNEENLEAWIRNPEQFKQGAKNPMPAFDHLSDEDMNALVEYLMNLKIRE